MSAIDSIRKHVHHLSVAIGQRGSTTTNERRAAKYAEKIYRDLGLAPQTETFTSAKSIWLPYAIGSSLVLLSVVIYWLARTTGAVIAAVLTTVTLVSLILELSFRPNFLRWVLPKGKSQNVSVRLDPVGESRQVLVLMGHLDTHRTPLSHRSPRMISFFTRLTTATFAGVIVLSALFAVSTFFDWPILRLIVLIPMQPVIVLFFIAASADRTPYSPGANDNATGAALTMALTERLVESPLQQTRVWAVNTGCEEVGACGAAAWVNAHRGELDGAYCLTLDNIGGAETSPCYLTSEGLIFPLRCDAELVEMADEIADKHPSLGAHSHGMKAAFTDSAIGIRAGLRCLTFVNYRPDGVIPHWHQPTDVVDNIDWDVVQRTEAFVWHLIQSIDQLDTDK